MASALVCLWGRGALLEEQGGRQPAAEERGLCAALGLQVRVTSFPYAQVGTGEG